MNMENDTKKQSAEQGRRLVPAHSNNPGEQFYRREDVEILLDDKGEVPDDCGEAEPGSEQFWMNEAARNQRNADYYRSLVERCGKAIGKQACIADDGGVSEDVLCAKVPELVEEMCSEARDLATPSLETRVKGRRLEMDFETREGAVAFFDALINHRHNFRQNQEISTRTKRGGREQRDLSAGEG